jgi:hypothetical protein
MENLKPTRTEPGRFVNVHLLSDTDAGDWMLKPGMDVYAETNISIRRHPPHPAACTGIRAE